MAKTPKHALTVLASPELTVGKEKIKSLEAAAVAQCAAVGQLESKAAAGAIMAGLTLHRVKASTPHGKFGSFIEQKLTKVNFWTAGTAKTNASYYMRLALAFVEKARADKGALLALPNDATTLDLGDTANAKKLAAALEKFVGDLSLTELLIKHNIKGVGLKTELAVGDDDAEDPSEMTPAQRATYEREQAFMGSLEFHAGDPRCIHRPRQGAPDQRPEEGPADQARGDRAEQTARRPPRQSTRRQSLTP